MVEEDSSTIETAHARLSDHDGQQRLGFFFFAKLGALMPCCERDLLYY